MQTLQNCLNQLMVSTMSEEGGQEEEIDGDIQERDSAELLKKIQAMLDTTKVLKIFKEFTVVIHSFIYGILLGPN